jgi:uncharacterized damage-inducible protein DinB
MAGMRFPSPSSQEEWELLQAEREWLRAAQGGAFAPWPQTKPERDRLRAMLGAYATALRDWRERHYHQRPPLAPQA